MQKLDKAIIDLDDLSQEEAHNMVRESETRFFRVGLFFFLNNRLDSIIKEFPEIDILLDIPTSGDIDRTAEAFRNHASMNNVRYIMIYQHNIPKATKKHIEIIKGNTDMTPIIPILKIHAESIEEDEGYEEGEEPNILHTMKRCRMAVECGAKGLMLWGGHNIKWARDQWPSLILIAMSGSMADHADHVVINSSSASIANAMRKAIPTKTASKC